MVYYEKQYFPIRNHFIITRLFVNKKQYQKLSLACFKNINTEYEILYAEETGKDKQRDHNIGVAAKGTLTTAYCKREDNR
jgi:hypothetical protein